MYVCMYGHHIQQSMDQPDKVANPARGQLNWENGSIPVSACASEILVSRDGFFSPSRPTPVCSFSTRSQADCGAY